MGKIIAYIIVALILLPVAIKLLMFLGFLAGTAFDVVARPFSLIKSGEKTQGYVLLACITIFLLSIATIIFALSIA